MSQLRIGELLGRLVNLSRHDIEEILEEQSGSHRRFGEIALAWGLCEPEHVWQAWCEQLLSAVQKVDLDTLGIDSQATGLIGRDLAARLGAIPIRCMGDTVIVALAEGDSSHTERELRAALPMKIRFVQADARQIERAIGTYYAAEPAAA